MRYKDWDIIIYPKGSDVPFREFKTTCYAINCGDKRFLGENGTNLTPLVTCFVPAIQAEMPFTVSLHSWVPPVHPGLQTSPVAAFPGQKALWQVKIIVDGFPVSVQLYPADCSWPQVISTGTTVNANGITTTLDLGWPRWNNSIIMQRNWDAAAANGRIKVELAAGFSEEIGGQNLFSKLTTIVSFSLFSVPINHLERCGIAWPNPNIFNNPVTVEPKYPTLFAQEAGYDPNHHAQYGSYRGYEWNAHKRNFSNGSITASSPLHGLPAPPPTTPVWSAHNSSSVKAKPMPCIWVNGELVPDPDALSDYSESPGASGSSPTKSAPRNRKSQLEVRLPSDQLQQLIHAINTPQNQETQTMTPGQAMPPPPLPAHARAAKAGSTGHVAQPSPDHVAQHAAGINIHQSTPRDESRGSDVSMHAGCTYFPNCTTEDDCGHVIHSSPAVTPSLIMGKKEGSSPAKPRDFMSTILGPQDQQMTTPAEKPSTMSSSSPAETPGRKRTRATLKALSLNDGSPEKKEASARKPARKVSRSSSNGSKNGKNDSIFGAELKALVADDDEDKENQMCVDL